MSTASRRARIALVGAGRIGRQHAAAVRRSPLLELAAVVDPRDEARAAVGADVETFESVDDLLDASPVDAVIVAVPSTLHGPVVSSALEAGVPILCEKPCGLDTTTVQALAAVAEERAIPLQVGYWRRFVPALRRLQERIASNALGEVAMLLAVQWDAEPPPAAFRDPTSSGGILIDMGVHEFDMLRWLTGQEIDGVVGYSSDVAWNVPVPGDPETVNLAVQLSDGATAVVSLARRHPPGDVCRVEVLGSDRAEAITFVAPGDRGAAMLDALQAQAEALVGHGTFAPARVGDAVSALDAATRAATALATMHDSASAR